MSQARDKVVVLLDLLAGMAYFHDNNDDELAEAYANLYQAAGLLLLSDSQSTPAERAKLLEAFYRLPKPDQDMVRALFKEVLL